MGALIEFVLSNFTLTFLVLGFVAAGLVIIAKRRRSSRGHTRESLLAWFLFFSIGVSFFYNFVMHVFFGDMAASFIGWKQSPFQAEVGFASLGFAVVGFLAFRDSFGLRLAAVLGPSLFLWGAAGGHIYQMIANDNLSPGNAGVVFWTDVFLPVLGFGLLWFRYGRNNLAAEQVSS
ncbi:MAG: DUF6790 family protein [Alphaproteobacteria bacterium]|jgi:hypothetical protein